MIMIDDQDDVEDSPELHRRLGNMYKMPSYQFSVWYLDHNRHSDMSDYKDSEGMEHSVDNTFRRMTSPQLRLVELDERLVSMVEGTDNAMFFRPLFHPLIFISNDFEFKGYVIKGIMITYHEDDKDSEDWKLSFVAIDPSTDCEYSGDIKLVDRDLEHSCLLGSASMKVHRMLCDRVRTLAVNIIDMIENQNDFLSIQTTARTHEQNIKRARRGKISLPTVVKIRPKGPFIAQVDRFNAHRTNAAYSHMFMVRGHWRHFRSEKYSPETRGTKAWILPFFKGSGVLVTKDYEVKV